MHVKPPVVFIDVPVRPLLRGGVLFQRSIRYLSSTPSQDPETGEMVILLKVLVRHFITGDDGTAGASAAELIPPYSLTFRADNTEAVDVATGAVVLTRTTETPAEWAALLAADPRQLMERGDAYRQVMHAGPVELVPQIEAAMRAADGPPYYRFGGGPALLS